MDVQFDHLIYWHLLWLVPVLTLVYVYGFARKGRGLRAFATSNLFTQLMPAVSVRRQKLKAVLVLAALTLLIVAATGPKWGKTIVDVQRRGIDLMVCLDVSRSMLAEDLKPNRLDRAKLELVDMLGAMHGDRVGLVTFAGNASLACPLTINYGAYRLALDDVTTRSVSRGGSLIGDAVRLAADSFSDKVKGHKAILVITDGEDQESFPVEAARKVFRERGIRVFTVGLGSMGEGARIPVTENGTKQYLQYKGEQVWSKMDRKTLEEMAVEGGGACFPASTADPDFVSYYDVMRNQVESRELESSRRELYNPRFQWFAGAALVVLLLEMLLSDRRRVVAEGALRQAA
ncbi:MAG TPA: VWA domain-containing protein [Phycisphaerae bacterium]|nr:VWA domain-containing protein [Phycisphaerae bacterium]